MDHAMNVTVIHIQPKSVYIDDYSHTTHTFATTYCLTTSFDPVKEGSSVTVLGQL